MPESPTKQMEVKKYSFLSGGGEMGELIRAKDWSKTPLGDPGDWPQSLRTMVSVMLDNPFGMYIAWGKEYTQIYNDGYRPILGATKHPKALGISTRETFAEIWHIIKSMFDGVMEGVPVGFPDFKLELDRNGFLETCYFDFAYSPIRMENGEVGGVLVTVIETTNKKKAVDELKESKKELEFVIEAAQLGIFDYDPKTNRFSGNARLKQWFGLPPNEQIDLMDAINAIAENDRERVTNSIQQALQFSSGGIYDVEYSIINPVSKKETIVHAKGRAWFDEDKVAYRMNGTLEDVTVQTIARRKTAQSEQNIRNMVLDAPIGICVIDADTLITEIANEQFIDVANQPYEAVVGKRFWDSFAHAEPYYGKALDGVVKTGIPFHIDEVEFTVLRNGKEEKVYVTFVYTPVKNEAGKVIKVAVWVVDNTMQVEARQKIAESETSLKLMIRQAPVAIAILEGADYTIEIANKHALEIFGRTEEEILGRSAFTSMPELLTQGIKELLDEVRTTGNRFAIDELPVQFLRNGVMETSYINFSYEPLFDEDGKINNIMAIGIDVSPQVLSRKKVEDSEIRYNLMLMQSPFAFLVLKGKDMVVHLANDSMKEVLGKGDNIEGKPLLEVIPEIKGQAFPDLLDNVYTTGVPFSANEMLAKLTRNGKLEDVYFNYVYQPYYEADKTISGVTVIAYDVTSSVLANKQIEVSEKRFRNLIAQATHPIFILRGEDLVLEVANDSLFKLWRVGPEAIGKPFLELLPEMKEQPYYDLLMDVFTNGVTHTGNEVLAYFNRPNGEEYSLYFNFIYLPFRETDGNISGVLVQAYDVTEQVFARKKIEESEQRTRSLVESAPFPIAVYEGKEMRIALANQSVMDIWGKGNDVVGKLYTDILPELVGQKIFEQVAAVLETGVPFHATNQKVDLVKNGALGSYYFNYSFTPLFDASGNPYAVMNTAAEVTELHEAKQKVEESEKRFKDSVKQAPLGIAIFRGKDFIAEMANENYLLLIDKKESEFIGKPLFEALPEVKSLVEPLFKDVISTGNAFYSPELPATLNRYGRLEDAYFNLVYHPLKEEDGSINGIMVVATEVTETVRAKHLLEESEKHFRNMVMQSPIPMTILRGEDYIIESANKVMFENMWRKKEVDVLGKSILDVFPELKEQKYPELLNKVFTSGKSHTEKESLAYVQGDDGMKKFYLDFEYAALFEPDGKVSGIMITVNDVTDKVEARKKVEEAEERTRLAAEATELATWELDLQSREMIHSPRMAEIYGHPLDKHLTHQEIRAQIPEDDRISIVEKAFALAMQTGVYFFEARMLRLDGNMRWIRVQGRATYNEQNEPVKMVGTLRDITEEKQYQQALLEREQKFRLLADSMPQHIWTADPFGQLNYFNQSVYDYSGLTTEQIEQDGWLQIVHPEDREENISTWMDSVSTGKDFLFEHRFRRYDGEYRWQLSRAIPQRDAEGNIQMWVGSSTDIQNIKEQEQQKDFFLSMASHELKTPVTSIKGYVQILQAMYGQGQDSFLLNSLKVVDRQIITLTKLISELLDISKIKSGGLDLNEETFEITDLIEEVTEGIKQINPDYEITILTEKKVTINADRDRISQVLINFLTNAIKYAPNSKKIHVKSLIEDNEVIVSVEDHGIGISKKEQEKIFDRFYRVEGKNEKTFPGFGIGLFIASEIIKKHNGKIGVQSNPGKGSVFYFSLPKL